MVSALSPQRNFREIATYSLFIAFLGLGVMISYTLFQFALPRPRYVNLGPASNFDGGSPTYLALSEQGQTFFLWVVKLDGRFHVFDARSTHSVAHDQNCIVKWVEDAQPWNSSKNFFTDPCVGGAWNPDGSYQWGPAPRDLDWYFPEVRDGELWIDIMYPQLGYSWWDRQEK